MSGDPSGERPKITLVTYGHVRPTHEGADGSAWELAEVLHREGRLDRVLCYGFEVADAGIPADRFASPGRRVFALASLVLARLPSPLGGFVRRARERLFDWLVARSPELRDAELVVFRKPNFERSARRLGRRGVPTVAIASILHPRLNYDRVGAEAARLGLDDRSPYRDRTRMLQVERFFESCSRILTTERVGETSFLEHGVPAERIVTTPLMNGADCRRFQPRTGSRAPGPLRFLHLSSMNLIKGVAILLEAWRDLALDDAELILAGSMDASTRSVHARIDPRNCRLLGPVEDTPASYRAADVFVSPSLSDSAPNTVLEALASGLPVIVSDACGASNLIEPGVNGFVYPWNDARALAAHMRWCHAHPDELAEMGRQARQTALANPRARFGEAVLRAVDDCWAGR